jgi:hypothetical protein
VLETAARAKGHAKQEILAYVAPLRMLTEARHDRRLRRFRPLIRPIPAGRRAVIDEVRTHGACVASLDALALPGTEELKSDAQRLRADLAQAPRGEQATVRLPRERLLECSSVWQWGLGEELLDTVEGYLGLPARYHGAGLRCERATGQAVGVRQWHRDVEDHQMLKLLIWLNDVDEDGGPFEYVDRLRTPDLTRSMRYISGYVSDATFEQQAPHDQWRRGTGPTWTCVVADPRNVFHRAMPPTGRDRYSLTFTYTSRWPLRTMPTGPVSHRERHLATRGLNDRQIASLPRAYTR